MSSLNLAPFCPWAYRCIASPFSAIFAAILGVSYIETNTWVFGGQHEYGIFRWSLDTILLQVCAVPRSERTPARWQDNQCRDKLSPSPSLVFYWKPSNQTNFSALHASKSGWWARTFGWRGSRRRRERVLGWHFLLVFPCPSAFRP